MLLKGLGAAWGVLAALWTCGVALGGTPCAIWQTLGTNAIRGASGEVRASTFFDFDGPGPQQPRLVIGGSFRVAGAVKAERVAQWDGTSFSPVGEGLLGTVNALHVFNGELYAGGSFTVTGNSVTCRRIARWNGTNWVQVGSGLGSTVSAFTTFNGELVAGGSFTTRGDFTTPMARVARFSGGDWQPVGAELTSTVNALAVFNNELIAGGSFTGNSILRIARFNGTAWQQLGDGVSSTVNALVVFGSHLIVGGSFSNAGGDADADRLAKWNGATFSSLGGVSFNSSVNALTPFGANLAIGGGFTNVNGNAAADRVVLWNGAAFSALSTGIESTVVTLAASGSQLVAGGNFVAAGGNPAERVAIYNGAVWSPLVGGDNGEVRAMHVFGGQVYAGGSFRFLGGTAINRLAVLNNATQNWQSVLTGADGDVRAISDLGGQLIAGGSFSTIGGAAVPFVARFNGATWLPLGAGVDGQVTVLNRVGSNVVVGGTFTTPGSNVARWDGATLVPMGLGFNQPPSAFAEFQGTTFATGSFTSSGSSLCVGIALFDGFDWYNVGGGLWYFDGQGFGNALAVFDNKLYVGGIFDRAGAVSAIGLAVWNGTSWSASPGWSNEFVTSLFVQDNRLYASTGGRVLRLGENGWAPLADGSADQGIRCLTGRTGELIIGGQFNLLDESIVAPKVATFPTNLPLLPTVRFDPPSLSVDTFDTVELNCLASETPAPGFEFRWYTPGGTLLATGLSSSGASYTVNGPVLTIQNITPAESGEYRCEIFSPDCGTNFAFISVFVEPPPTCAPDWTPAFPVTPALGGAVRAIAQFDHDSDANTPRRAVIGGAFSKIGSSPLLRVAHFDGSGWQPLGAGFNGVVNALLFGDIDESGGPLPARLYAAGAFTASGGTVLNRVGFWDGTSWQPLGAGFNGPVNALVLADIDDDGPLPLSLIAGGAFTKSGTTVVNRIARFDGSAWQPIATGFNGAVNDMKIYTLEGALDKRLVVAGAFTRAGTTVVNRIASFDGSAFQPIGAGFNGPVFAITLFQDAFVVGGSFTRSGTSVFNRVARISADGVFSPVGQGFNAPVLALSAIDLDGFGPVEETLLAGGQFTRSGLNLANRIARFSGTDWVSLGLGADGAVRTIAGVTLPGGLPATPVLCIGGDFKTAGGFLQRAAAAFACPNTLPFLRASMPTSRAVIPAGPADIAGVGGLGTLPDGQVDADDVIAFVEAWTRRDPAADVAGPPLPDGSPSGPDFRFTVDDILAFVSGVATPE